eukprot:GFKZ01013421.1.p1 GENE.GFKZ01013421.1~~GFKZ01013421.1.p1  ORF type:complete len:159 (-),score=9.75 GFKZ01013421.1:751-1158(-)
MPTRHLPLLTFLLGILSAYLLSTLLTPTPWQPPPQRPPFQLAALPEVGVSHDPHIRKRVMATYFQMPHVTQIAKAVLRPGQVASENWYVHEHALPPHTPPSLPPQSSLCQGDDVVVLVMRRGRRGACVGRRGAWN